ncbi:MAG: ATPase, T2SS/T4P/T4SS family [bacterium]|nr:ATPase, T2SS/T4P/T4SS family [bacterium]
MIIESKRLKLFLLDSDLVSPKDIEVAEKEAEKTKTPLGDVLVTQGKISESDLIRLEAYILGIPFVDLGQEHIDPDVLRVIPEPIARKHNIIAYRKRGDVLEVAMLDPEDLETVEFIKKKSNLKIAPRFTSREGIKGALSQYQKSLKAEFGDIIKEDVASISLGSSGGKGEEQSQEDLEKLAEDLPVVRIVETLLKHAIVQKASDIHIEPLENEVIVRYRIDGILHDAMVLPRQIAPGIIARIKVLSNLKLDEHRLPQDGRFKTETQDEKISFRVSILPIYGGEKAVLRILHEGSQGFTLEVLGFHDDQLDLIQKAIKRPTGMILATGPTGSGKTTTLYTVLDILNTPEVNISTIEDPIEYRMPRINQSQVRPDIGYTFANGLRSLLRQDPDIIMVGEIRDAETAALAVNAALTGHLVLSTLHTNSAAGALPRLIEMGVEPFLIASTVNVIVAQRLVRQLCKSKKQYALSEKDVKEFGQEVDPARILEVIKRYKAAKEKAMWKDVFFAHPEASSECADGYKGRIGIHETLYVSEAIKEMIIRSASSDEIARQAKKEGMVTMFEDGIAKAAQGLTSVEEVLRVSSE